MKIVIENYFKTECNVDTSIREAFEKGFRIGVKKALSAEQEIIRCKDCKHYCEYGYGCTFTSKYVNAVDFCSKAERR